MPWSSTGKCRPWPDKNSPAGLHLFSFFYKKAIFEKPFNRPVMNLFVRILFFPLAAIRLVLIVLNTLISMLLSMAEDYLTGTKRPYRFLSTRYWGKSCLLILGFRVAGNKRPAVRKYILMSNHRSYIDIFVWAALSPSTFVAKAELLHWPLIGRALQSIRAITVRRDEMKSLLETMQKMGKAIEQGMSITLFPEGTTSKGDGILPFKNGSFKIAAQLQAPVIPCALFYPCRAHCWVGSDTFIGHFLREMGRPFSRVSVCFGDPVVESDFSVLKGKIRATINEMLEKMENNSGKDTSRVE